MEDGLVMVVDGWDKERGGKDACGIVSVTEGTIAVVVAVPTGGTNGRRSMG